jgi:hypothetical protein
MFGIQHPAVLAARAALAMVLVGVVGLEIIVLLGG